MIIEIKKKTKDSPERKIRGRKNYLLKMLLGFTKPAEGTLYFRSQAIDSRTCWEARKEIAYVAQDTDLGEGKVKEIKNK